MSYQRGWDALNLRMPDRIPHTEYFSHGPFIRKVTGLALDDPRCGPELARVTDFDLIWNNFDLPGTGRLTHMGTAHWYEGQETPDNRECPFPDEEAVLAFDPVAAFPVPSVAEVAADYERRYQQGQRAYPEAVFPGGYYNTIFSWCILTFGWERFLTAAALDMARFDRVLEGFFELSRVAFEASAQTSMKAFICHDDIVWTAGPVFSPDWYRRYVFPRYQKLWRPLKEAGKILLFCSDGNFTMFVDDLVECGADGFIFEPLTSLEQIAAKYGQSKVMVGNVDCRILTYGTPEQIEAEVRRCADIGRSCPGYFFAVGNHIPYNVPLEHVELYLELIRRYGRR